MQMAIEIMFDSEYESKLDPTILQNIIVAAAKTNVGDFEVDINDYTHFDNTQEYIGVFYYEAEGSFFGGQTVKAVIEPA